MELIVRPFTLFSQRWLETSSAPEGGHHLELTRGKRPRIIDDPLEHAIDQFAREFTPSGNKSDRHQLDPTYSSPSLPLLTSKKALLEESPELINEPDTFTIKKLRFSFFFFHLPDLGAERISIRESARQTEALYASSHHTEGSKNRRVSQRPVFSRVSFGVFFWDFFSVF
jgi:hypothetical protein